MKHDDIKVGMFIGCLNNIWRGAVPCRTPLIVKSVGKARITAEPLKPEGRDSEFWSPRVRHLKATDIIAIYPDEATGRWLCEKAYRIERDFSARILELEGESKLAVYAALRGE